LKAPQVDKTTAYSPLFDGVATWLLEQGLHHAGLTEIVQGLGQRLVAGGVPLHRISIGGMLLHPTFGALDVVWEAPLDQIRSSMASRAAIYTPEFQDSPFFIAARDGIPFQRFPLERPELETEYPIFEQLRASGVTDYIVFYRTYGRRDLELWSGLPQGMEGALGSFSTRRIGGFTDMEVDYLRALTTPLGLIIKAKTSHELAKTLLDTYLGRYSGGQVLNGLVERGSGRPIDCVLWYCDLRGSTALAEQLSMDDYLATLDAYFDCTAGAVLDHGGEVLKFIGDAVMAIFPFDEAERPAVDMCRAAMSAAREAISKVERGNAEREKSGLPPIKFGVALHVGQVMYGNVGTQRRLDFTVIGPAANEATRLEGLTKQLRTPVVASAEFSKVCPEELVALGTHEVAGVASGLDAYTLIDLAPPSDQAAR
jgi:adenylate cyclase